MASQFAIGNHDVRCIRCGSFVKKGRRMCNDCRKPVYKLTD